MPKLTKALAKAANEKASEWNDRTIAQPGTYLCQLKGVETKTGQTSGKPYWNWTFDVVEVGEQPAGTRFWDITSLSEGAIGRLGTVMAAFGVPTDYDTDDLIGSFVSLTVTIGTTNTGNPRNDVRAYAAADSHPLWGEFNAGNVGAIASADDFG